MTKTIHTPGPWHVGEGNGAGSVFADEGRMRLNNGATTLYPIAHVNVGWDEAEDAANAALIAAAPELLKALESTRQFVVAAREGADGLVREAIDYELRMIDAALAKART